MNRKRLVSLLVTSLCVSSAFALETLPEDELAQSSAQDGISVLLALPAAGWTAQSIALIDKTGIPSAIKPGFEFNRGDLIARSVGVKTCSDPVGPACTSNISPSIALTIDTVGDTDGNSSTPDSMLNLSLSLTGGATKLRFYIDKIGLRNGFGANETTFIDFVNSDGVGDYIDIFPIGGGPLLNLQLGSETAGHMLTFANGNFGTIDFGTIFLRDKTDTLNGGACATCNLSYTFKMDNVDLTGAGFDISNDGLVFSVSSFLTPIDITFGNIRAGNSGTNMGTIGVKGLQVTNLALTISGKS